MAHRPAWAIGHAIGRTELAVRTKAALHGIRLGAKRGGCWPADTVRRARKLREAGKPLSAISEATGVPFGTLRQWIYGGYRRDVA